jgi:glutamine cyclotransferase
MKKSIRHFTVVLFISFAFAIIVTSCNKDDSNMTKKEMLTAKSWKISSSKTNGVADVIEDCQKDDFLTFATDGTYTFNPGTNKCFSTESIDNGTWELTSDEKYLIVDGDSITIVELTASRFTFKLVDADYNMEATYVSF